MLNPIPHDIETDGVGGKLTLKLWQWKPKPLAPPDRPVVLLLHGASANHKTFLHPGPDPENHEPRSLVDSLHMAGFEPWMLDWRGNGLFSSDVVQTHREVLDFDHAASSDIPKAIEFIQATTDPPREISLVGHCMGAASIAQAVAQGSLRPSDKLHRIILMTIGLFYEPAQDGRARSEDFTLERIWRENKADTIDPRFTSEDCWPKHLATLYEEWPERLLPHHGADVMTDMEQLCNRVSFMFGQPYRELNLDASVHEGTFLAEQFGGIPLRMFLQAARNVRRGRAAPFEAKNDDYSLVDDTARKNFDGFTVTLITGAKNELWHRESIDKMQAWLDNLAPNFSRKKIFDEYGHQDLLWGTRAYEQVFPFIEEALRRPRKNAAASPVRNNPVDSPR